MPMLDARDAALREQYPRGCRVYDARGRLLRFVVACNPETGEVIRCEGALGGVAIAIDVSGVPLKRHGFWPAPLRVVSAGGCVPADVPYRVGDGTRERLYPRP